MIKGGIVVLALMLLIFVIVTLTITKPDPGTEIRIQEVLYNCRMECTSCHNVRHDGKLSHAYDTDFNPETDFITFPIAPYLEKGIFF